MIIFYQCMCVNLLNKFLYTKSMREKVGKFLRPLKLFFFFKAQNEPDSMPLGKKKASQLDRCTKAHNVEML